MTIPVESTRALLLVGGFLIELARDERLPVDIRRGAVFIARYFPTIEDVAFMAAFRHKPSGLGVGPLDASNRSIRQDCAIAVR